MSSIDFLFADPNWPFLAAAAATLIIGAVELIGMLMGLGLSHMIDDLLPDLDFDADADLDGGADPGGAEASGAGALARALGWLNVGRVPFLVLLICFLALFAISGLVMQILAQGVIGLLPALIAAPLAGALALPGTRMVSRALARVVPREETYAVSDAQLIGRVAAVTLGPVSRDTPGKAKVSDQHGNLHFVRVRAAKAAESHDSGAAVLLVSLEDAVFEVIAAPPHLAPDDPNDPGYGHGQT